MRTVVGLAVLSVCLLVGGAYLIGWWMVGIVLMVLGLAVAALALTAEIDDKQPDSGHPAIERFKRMR